MGETWMGLAIGGSALTVALAVAIALHWLERRRARRLRDFDHHDCWLVAYGKCIVRRPVTRARRGRAPAAIARLMTRSSPIAPFVSRDR
ncbi:hypothetical protein [Burkholderia multivorans]|uniref:hypothetical protein n=1 Tax=Burkholderia multivorans TaxID=87883 RepID=UPI0019D2B7F5|nr:hypothetical protein [Burkholderia multivorans]MBN6730098.1 hypothetical protein [Burkholderia multivorans]MBN6736401.1 hypothetical protein [Burkholderia multivorans]MBN7129948.1 hypothetical protein [Burkholderia multivorans]MBN8164165.1 hypothetical protein [Burkholderia multivorans]MBN8168435.1 hypothetical protein [Burkholderia multivorans]